MHEEEAQVKKQSRVSFNIAIDVVVFDIFIGLRLQKVFMV